MVDQYEKVDDEVKERSIRYAANCDQPTLYDSLGFAPYVEAIKEFLTNPDTKPPLTLSIEGSWGSGKSSFMLQLRKKLEEKGERTVQFDAWRHDKEDTMWAAFALEFIRQLSKDLTPLDYFIAECKLFKSRIYASNKKYDVLKIKVNAIIIFGYVILLIIGYVTGIYKNFAWINSLPTLLMVFSFLCIGSPIYIPILSVVPNLKKLLGNSISDLKKCIKKPDYENRTTFIEEFHEDFKNIVECYAQGEKVFVFIEDLDRCEVPKAADLMQALNLMISNDPRLIFIIGMDRLKVASGFAVKYENLLPYLQSSKESFKPFSIQNGNYYKGLEYGYEFLEKFIQLSFLVPQPGTTDLQKLVYNEDEIDSDGKKKVDNHQLNVLWIKVSKGIKDYYNNIKNKNGQQIVVGKTDDNNVEIISNNQNKGFDAHTKEQIEKQKIFIETLRIKVDPKSETIHEIIEMVSPTLDYNPRRIKQFINLFRLKVFIAGETGLFCHKNTSTKADLTLEKLGKIVAITLKWPLILSHLDFNHKLLDELQQISLDDLDKTEKISEEAKYWIVQEKLIDLLRYGCSIEGPIEPEKEKYSLLNLDIDKLLQTSQRMDRSTILQISDIKAKILETDFHSITYVEQAWLSLHKLTHDKNKDYRWQAAKKIGTSYNDLPNKQEAEQDLKGLVSDGSEIVRVYANHSLGRIFIIKASQAEKEEDYRDALERAISFFENSSKESSKEFNPSKFCFLFYSLFYTVIFSKNKTVNYEVDRYLEEAKKAIGESKNKKLLFEALENFVSALKEIQSIESMNLKAKKEQLNLYRNHCVRLAELMKETEKAVPSITKVMKMGSQIFDKRLKNLLEEIQKKAEDIQLESQGTAKQEIASAVNKEIQKWEVGNQKYLVTQIENLVYLLKSNIPKIEENSLILNRIDQILQEQDIVKQYTLLNKLIPQIIDIQLSEKTDHEANQIVNESDERVVNADPIGKVDSSKNIPIYYRNIHISNRTKETVRIATVQLHYELSNIFPFHIIKDQEEIVKQKILNLLDKANQENVDILCLPELSINEKWLDEIKSRCNKMIVVSGSYYDNKNHNVCQILMNSDTKIPPQFKISPSDFEDTSGVIEQRMMSKESVINLYDTQFGRFAVLICRDFGNFSSILKGKLDIIFVPLFNRSNNRFHQYADLHVKSSPSYVIMSNNSIYGGTSIFGIMRYELFGELEQKGFKGNGDTSYKLCEIEKGKEGMIIADFNLIHKYLLLPQPMNPEEDIMPVSNIKKILF